MGALGFVACGSTSRQLTSVGAHAGSGLRSVAGYGDYDECRSGCVGGVPAGLRRPLRLERLRAGEACPITRAFAATADFYRPLGRGPVYPAITASRGAVHLPSRASHGVFAGSAWSGFKVLWVAQPSYQGPVLIRGRRLDRPGAVGFGLGIVPNDELQLPPGDRAGAPPSPHGWRNWPSTSRARSPGCYAWQIDGTGFSRIVVARVG
jgi:hypothetical protein